MSRLRGAVCALAALLLFPNITLAAVSFDIGANGALNGSSGNRFVIGTGYGVDTGSNPENGGKQLDVVFTIDSNLPNVAFSLNSAGDFSTFTYANIRFQEPNTGSGGNLGINGTEAVADLSVTAYLSFVLPPVGDEPIGSTPLAFTGTIIDSPEAVDFQITFAPQTVNFGVGGQFRIDLSAVSFTTTPQDQTVNATVTLLSAPTTAPQAESTPEPASLAIWSVLLGSVGIGIYRRKI